MCLFPLIGEPLFASDPRYRVRSIPSDDLSVFIAYWNCAKKEPTILSIGASQPRLHLTRLPRTHEPLPGEQQLFQVSGMNSVFPSPPQPLFHRKTRVVEPGMIQKFGRSVQPAGPRPAGHRVDHGRNWSSDSFI